MKVSDAEKRQFPRSDEKVVQDFASQQEMFVFDKEMLTYFFHHIIWYDITFFLVLALDTPKSYGWILADVATFEEIARESFNPCEIVVTSGDAVITVNEDVVQKLTDIVLVPLVGVINVDFLFFFPSLQHPDTAGVVHIGFFSQAMLIVKFHEILFILGEDIVPSGIF